VLNGLHRNFKMNITPSEEKAMKDLLNDPTIIIRPADKGSGIVILDANSYAGNLKQEIHDKSTYKEVPTDLTRKIHSFLHYKNIPSSTFVSPILYIYIYIYIKYLLLEHTFYVVYAGNLKQEIHDKSTYKEVPTDLTRKIENKVKKLANEMFKRGSITKDIINYSSKRNPTFMHFWIRL
jgi:predicted lactoylglutathione lyase